MMRAPRLVVALAAGTTVIVAAAIVLRPAPRATPQLAPPAPRPPTAEERAQLRAEPLEHRFQALKPLHHPAPPIMTGDWLATNPEPGQTFAAYVDGGPVRATATRRTVYLQPIGDFSPAQLRLLAQTEDYVARFFQLPVVTLPTLPSSTIPPAARRRNQLLTTHILEQVLMPSLKPDAIAALALTSEDLYPGEGWNFVFGEASSVDRVGVWSIFRNGPAGSPEALARTLKTATHELAHMLSIEHCVAWSCVMAGSNSLMESDLQPAWLCPVCLQKLTWNVGLDPARRATELSEFYADAGMSSELAQTEKERAALSGAR